eukprot:5678091-Pyramimonas_sp.AAC.1
MAARHSDLPDGKSLHVDCQSLIHGASRPLWARSHKCEHATFWRALGSKVPSLVKVKAHRNVESANSDLERLHILGNA